MLHQYPGSGSNLEFIIDTTTNEKDWFTEEELIIAMNIKKERTLKLIDELYRNKHLGYYNQNSPNQGYFITVNGGKIHDDRTFLKEGLELKSKQFVWKYRLIPWIFSLIAITISVFSYFKPEKKLQERLL